MVYKLPTQVLVKKAEHRPILTLHLTVGCMLLTIFVLAYLYYWKNQVDLAKLEMFKSRRLTDAVVMTKHEHEWIPVKLANLMNTSRLMRWILTSYGSVGTTATVVS